MSSLDNLPPIIASIPPISIGEFRRRPDIVDVKPLPNVESAEPIKRFIIVCSRSISDEDISIFEQFGKVKKWTEAFLNVSFDELEFDYLVIDIRSKQARLTLNRQELDKYNVVAYVWALQKGLDDFISEVNAIDISSVPKDAINRNDFNHQLLNQKITAPSVLKSFLRLVLACWSK